MAFTAVMYLKLPVFPSVMENLASGLQLPEWIARLRNVAESTRENLFSMAAILLEYL